ncbi:MAG TPA: class I SAM-dependent methyltransferase [Terriglobia bacterium]|nr:class I SAM-dependent methyltransferase [Terriglobia bacterium]
MTAQCRVCDSPNLQPAIDLGLQPWCNHFLSPHQAGTEPFYPLRVVQCERCRTAQLDFTVKKEILFGDHTYLSGITKTLSTHFANVANEVDERFMYDRSSKSVLDIGSNDGTQLKHYKALGYSVLGVESSKSTAAIANACGIETLQAFFNESTARSLGRKFDVINASGVFFHLEELHSVTDGIRRCLKDDGVFVVQFLYMKQIIENLAFDQIYHEHLLYYNLTTIQTLLQRHGLSMFDCYLSPIHGGSIIGFVTHAGKKQRSPRLEMMLTAEEADGWNEIETYRQFSRDIEIKKEESLAFLHDQRRQGKRIFGFGAPVKGNTLLNYFRIGRDLLDCLVEKNPLRKGLLSPGMHIPVVLEDEIDPPDTYYVLAWNFKDEIIRNNRDLIETGVSFYFPVETKFNESARNWSHRLSWPKPRTSSEDERPSGDWDWISGVQPSATREPAPIP